MPVNFTSRELSEKYDRFAPWYDWVEGVPDLLGVRRLRRRLLRQASGKVLEVAVGTGKNVQYYPRGCRIIGIDVSREMLKVARERAVKLSMEESPVFADGGAWRVYNHILDTVVSSLSTCTFPNPVPALGEMARVCKPAARIL